MTRYDTGHHTYRSSQHASQLFPHWIPTEEAPQGWLSKLSLVPLRCICFWRWSYQRWIRQTPDMTGHWALCEAMLTLALLDMKATIGPFHWHRGSVHKLKQRLLDMLGYIHAATKGEVASDIAFSEVVLVMAEGVLENPRQHNPKRLAKAQELCHSFAQTTHTLRQLFTTRSWYRLRLRHCSDLLTAIADLKAAWYAFLHLRDGPCDHNRHTTTKTEKIAQKIGQSHHSEFLSVIANIPTMGLNRIPLI